jgi:hypothetical protein
MPDKTGYYWVKARPGTDASDVFQLHDGQQRIAYIPDIASLLGFARLCGDESLINLDELTIVRPVEGRCKDCKWWAADESYPKAFSGWGWCLLAEKEGSLASTSNEGLLVSPDFGCVQWEGKGSSDVR